MKMQDKQWVRIDSEDKLKLFEQVNPDLKWDSTEQRERVVRSGYNCWVCSIGRRASYAPCEKSAASFGYTEYKLPDCGPIPEGWRLVDTSKDLFRTDAKYWSDSYQEWRTTMQVTAYSGDTYIIPDDKPVETKPEPKQFPPKHWFFNTPENVAAFKRDFPESKVFGGDIDHLVKNGAKIFGSNDNGILDWVASDTGYYRDRGYIEFVFYKPEPKQFPKGHYFLNTPENVAAFKRELPEVRSVIGDVVGDFGGKCEAYGYGYTGESPSKKYGLNCLTHGTAGSYTRDNFKRYYFEHEKQEVAAETFPDNHYFKNTPENIEEFLRRFKGVKSNLGYAVDQDWFSSRKENPEFGMDRGKLGHVSSSGRGWYADHGYIPFVFEREKQEVAAQSGEQAKPAWVDKFVPNTFIRVNAENAEEVKKHLAGMKWRNGKAFQDYKPSYWPDCKLFNTAGELTHSDPGYVSKFHSEIVVNANPEPVRTDYRAGDMIVVTKSPKAGSETAFWTSYKVGDVAEVVEVRNDGAVIDARRIGDQHSCQGLAPTQIRLATKQEVAIASAGPTQEEWTKATKTFPGQITFADVVKKANPEFYIDQSKLVDPKITFTAEPGLGKAGCVYAGSSQPIGVTIQATESIPAGTLVSFVPTSTSEKDEKMLTQSERDEVVKLAVQAAQAASATKSGPGVASKATGLCTSAAKGLMSWALAPAKPVGRLAIKLLQYGVFLVGVVGGGSYLAYWTYNNGKDYLPTIEFKKPEDKSPKDSVMNSVTHFATTGEINS